MAFVPHKNKTDFEKVATDEWLEAEIIGEDIFKDVEQKFTNKEGNADIRKVDMVRFKFKIKGYEYNHYSRKMTLSMNQKANLFIFLQQIYGQSIVPDIAVNTDKLIGLKVKVMFVDSGEYQNLSMIRPLVTPPAIWDLNDDGPKDNSAELTGDTPF